MTGNPTDASGGGRFELDPPLTQVAWSAEFGSRALEIFFVCLVDGAPWALQPIHADSLMLGWSPDAQPGTVVVEAARRYGLEPALVHSSSWRVAGERLVLTYLVIVPAPRDPGPHLAMRPIARTGLARGDALAAPANIGTDAVLEHALRHLAWLIGDDTVVRDAAADWAPVLASYAPEPFRAFDAGAP